MDVQSGDDVITSVVVEESQKLPVRAPHRRQTYRSVLVVDACAISVLEVCAFSWFQAWSPSRLRTITATASMCSLDEVSWTERVYGLRSRRSQQMS